MHPVTNRIITRLNQLIRIRSGSGNLFHEPDFLEQTESIHNIVQVILADKDDVQDDKYNKRQKTIPTEYPIKEVVYCHDYYK